MLGQAWLQGRLGFCLLRLAVREGLGMALMRLFDLDYPGGFWWETGGDRHSHLVGAEGGQGQS